MKAPSKHIIEVNIHSLEGIHVVDGKLPEGKTPKGLSKVSAIVSFTRNKKITTSISSGPLQPSSYEMHSDGSYLYRTDWTKSDERGFAKILLETNLHPKTDKKCSSSEEDGILYEPKKFDMVLGLQRGTEFVVLAASIVYIDRIKSNEELSIPLVPVVEKIHKNQPLGANGPLAAFRGDENRHYGVTKGAVLHCSISVSQKDSIPLIAKEKNVIVPKDINPYEQNVDSEMITFGQNTSIRDRQQNVEERDDDNYFEEQYEDDHGDYNDGDNYREGYGHIEQSENDDNERRFTSSKYDDTDKDENDTPRRERSRKKRNKSKKLETDLAKYAEKGVMYAQQGVMYAKQGFNSFSKSVKALSERGITMFESTSDTEDDNYDDLADENAFDAIFGAVKRFANIHDKVNEKERNKSRSSKGQHSKRYSYAHSYSEDYGEYI